MEKLKHKGVTRLIFSDGERQTSREVKSPLELELGKLISLRESEEVKQGAYKVTSEVRNFQICLEPSNEIHQTNIYHLERISY